MVALAIDVSESANEFRRKIAEGLSVKKYGREVSAMTPQTRFVHVALCEYYDHPAMRGSGGAGMSIIARMMKYGSQGASQHGSTVPMELPDRLKVVGEAVRALNGRMHTAITVTYGNNEPIECLARELHVSHAVARSLLKNARPLIGAFLAGRGWKLPYENP